MAIPEYYLKIMYSIKTDTFSEWVSPASQAANPFNTLITSIKVIKSIADVGWDVFKWIGNMFMAFAKMLMLAWCIVYAFWVCVLFMINVFVAITNLMIMVALTSIFLVANLVPVARETWGMNPLNTTISAGLKVLFVFMFVGTMMNLIVKINPSGEPPKFDEVTLMDLIRNIVILWFYMKVSVLGLNGGISRL